MSLLLASGHQFAEDYPVAIVWSEARLCRQREISRIKHEAIAIQSTIASIFAKKEALLEFIQRLEASD